MSRAFVKETDETFDELPDRPISPNPNIVTAQGLAAIEATLARLQQEHAVRKHRAIARSWPRSLAKCDIGLPAERRPK
jgi:hypothetical protein